MFATLLAAISSLALALPEPDKAPRKVTPVVALHGRQCAVKTGAAHFVTSAKEFDRVEEKLSLRLNGEPILLDVDYSKCVVVVLCSGEDTNLGRRLSAVGRVELRYDCFLYTSARRYIAMGKGAVFRLYVRNFVSELLHHTPKDTAHLDVRH